MSTEKRMLVAFVISALIFVVWAKLFPPPEQIPEVEEPVGVEETVAKGEIEDGYPGEEGAEKAEPVDEDPYSQPEKVIEEKVVEATEATVEEKVRFENSAIILEMSNRGAKIESLQLIGYEGDDRKGNPLDIVQHFEGERRTTTLQLIEDGEPDQRMYEVERFDNGCLMRWADGRGSFVEKEIGVSEDGYGIEFSIRAEGLMKNARLSVGSGMRDTGPVEMENRLSQWGNAVLAMGEEIERIKRTKVKEKKVFESNGLLFAGFEDTYFINVIRPRSRVSDIWIEPITYQPARQEGEEEREEVKVLEVSVGLQKGRLEAELLAAPKEYNLMRSAGGGLERTVDFGFFHPISVFFMKALWWIYERMGNYGLAIIMLTIAIRIVLFPLMHKSTVSMRRMAKLQPKIKAIQSKYKKQKTDPQVRQKMSQETMELYKQEGVNPVGGCLPILVQLPILWALYQLFLKAIELRHAPFMLWIEDLSAKDPYYVTPILMAATMWLQQKLAPQTGDPQQQRIFRMMPIIFGFMFLNFPAGLVLYWLTNNVITILQQEITLRLIGEKGTKKSK
jgi:YidC/Oxa1 family membrane protein insertase